MALSSLDRELSYTRQLQTNFWAQKNISSNNNNYNNIEPRELRDNNSNMEPRELRDNENNIEPMELREILGMWAACRGRVDGT